MNRKTAMKLFGLLGLLMLLSCGYADRHRNNSSCEQVLVDSLEVRIQDSLFSNVHYSRSRCHSSFTGKDGRYETRNEFASQTTSTVPGTGNRRYGLVKK